MKAEWTSTTPEVAKVTLGDDAAKHTLALESLGGGASEQVVPLFRAANPARFMRGNSAGEVVISAAKSHESRAAAATFFKGEYGRINQVGTLELTIDATVMSFAGATLKAVTAVGVEGLRWTVRYQFGITTVS